MELNWIGWMIICHVIGEIFLVCVVAVR